MRCSRAWAPAAGQPTRISAPNTSRRAHFTILGSMIKLPCTINRDKRVGLHLSGLVHLPFALFGEGLTPCGPQRRVCGVVCTDSHLFSHNQYRCNYIPSVL